MQKKGGIFKSLILSVALFINTAHSNDIFKNSTLINIDESHTFDGRPLLYIEGIKAPEKATNDMEELQLKHFGTKKIRETTKHNLQLSPSKIDVIKNKEENYTFTTFFGQTVKAGFIPHFPDFMTIIQILDRKQISVSENINILNTDKTKTFQRTLHLPEQASAKITSFIINGQPQNIPKRTLKTTEITISGNTPLELGPNKISLKYTLENAIQNNKLDLTIIGTETDLPINRFKVLTMMPAPIEFQENKLVFGTNQIEIPSIYKQITDQKSTTSYTMNRIIPEHAAIQLKMAFDSSKLPQSTKETTTLWINVSAYIALTLYWIITLWWERRKLNKTPLPIIKYPKTVNCLANQLETTLTPRKWNELIKFATMNKLPTLQIEKEKLAWEKNKNTTSLKTKIKTFISIGLETLLGTITLTVLGMLGFTFIPKNCSWHSCIIYIIYAIIGFIYVYKFGLKKTRHNYWRKKIQQLENPDIITGMTQNQIRQNFPLFILIGKQEEWQTKIIKTNPKAITEMLQNKEKNT